MNNFNIINIFPTPIYFSNLERNFTKKEILFTEQTKNKVRDNDGNVTSIDNYILNNKCFSQLKKDLTLKVNDYFNKIICPLEEVKPYITQSWLNYTKKNDYHHSHEHPNSFVSGVFYFNADPDVDTITFMKKDYNQISLEIKEYNLFNSKTWWFPIQTGQLILFPSSTTHFVSSKQGENLRTSLAFNVFIKGKLGNNKSLTELIL